MVGLCEEGRSQLYKAVYFLKFKTPLTVPEVKFCVLYHTELSLTRFYGEITIKQQHRLCNSEGLDL